jgi:hypothetical protein
MMSVSTQLNLMLAALEHLVDSMCHLSSLSAQAQAVADQFAQLSTCATRNGTPSYQPVTEEVGDPFSVFDISFAARTALM